METLTLTCLGGFAARCGEREVEIGPRKVRALLAYLALAGPGRHRREALAGLLWGRSAQRQALNSLNQALYTLRRALDAAGCDLLESDAETVGLRSAGVQTDAAEMEAAAGRDEPASLRQALALHRGPLLDGLSVPEEGFEVWLAAERTRLADVAAAAGVRLMDLAPPADDALPEDARRLLAIDPYSDAACRALVRHHADAGRTARAIAIYEDHARTLHADLGVGPSEAMAHLIAAVRAGKVAPGPPAPPGAAPAAPRRPRALALAIALAVLVSAALGAIFLAKRPDPRPAADRPYLLVLPAASADRAAPQAAIGLIDDLSTELAGLPGLAVFARETARARDDWTSGSARAAGASHMLATTLRDEGGQLTLNARLVETASGIEVWARRFTLRRDSFRQLRDRMVGEIADALAAEFAAGDAATPRIDPEAYESYLAGLAAYHRASPAANAQARGAFARALALDPGLDAARAGLVRVHYRAAFGAQAYADALDLSWIEAYLQLKALIGAAPEAGSAADRAIEARLRLRRHDLAGATATARAALARVPSDAEALLTLAEAAAYLGEVEEALAAARQALALNPARAARAYFAMALAHVGAGATDQAARSLAEAGRGPDAAALVELPALAAAVAGLQGDRHAARAHLAAYAAALEERPRGAWRLARTLDGNPRSLTWARPTLASALSGFPFAGAATLDRVAAGLDAAGIAGVALGYRRLVPAHRLGGEEIRGLLFGHGIEGAATPLFPHRWRQVRTGEGALFQDGAAGPAPGAVEGRSVIWDDQLCDRWTFRDHALEACALIYRSTDDAPLPGNHVMITEIGVFPFDTDP